ncbi:hypothetical protein [Mucilaginibacter lacusdianchii]|uniref:hypothetical protein n=1 Tax=Mucilaginibacter lacusdianchii TaxID=2684211 RepID=UPI00131AD531|nr:hypothetical protein [Mucilaginibacter sp. JXJ CY 39]
MSQHKYQFTIFEYSDKINNSAATKAVADCNKIFSLRGYKDFTLTVDNTAGRTTKFYLNAFIAICKFILKVERGALIGIQYPMLNNVFKYFIKAAKLKQIKFFCIIHDVESLRLGGNDINLVARETSNLNYYDFLIVHNDSMMKWLKEHGVTSKMHSLQLFDYLAPARPMANNSDLSTKTIVYAGNLSKSTFIYKLGAIDGWIFNVYGPHFLSDLAKDTPNLNWKGVFNPDEVVYNLQGRFGLIWDGEDVEKLDSVWGNYIKYNNPHKASLYLAAGLPVIAPRNSAIGKLVDQWEVGVLIDNLTDLNNINIQEQDYLKLKNNCISVQKKLINGYFFADALAALEKELS